MAPAAKPAPDGEPSQAAVREWATARGIPVKAARRYLVDRVGMSDDEAREALAGPASGPTSGHTGRPAGCPCQFPPTDTRNCACAKTPLIGDL